MQNEEIQSYAASKPRAEGVLKLFKASSPVAVLNPFNAWSPGTDVKPFNASSPAVWVPFSESVPSSDCDVELHNVPFPFTGANVERKKLRILGPASSWGRVNVSFPGSIVTRTGFGMCVKYKTHRHPMRMRSGRHMPIIL
uniref:NTP_transf_2 domain-containing protein n=1 Tax=Globodera pallida TaxID=36090 RepID=A0A183C3N3_GLOPA